MTEIEVVGVRHPGGEITTTVYLNGQPVPDARWYIPVPGDRRYVIDAGRGYAWPDWIEHRDRCLHAASSQTVRDALLAAFDDPPGGEQITDRAGAPWLPGQITFRDGDDTACSCGNTTDTDGFYPSLPDASLIEPTVESGWQGHYRCARCGAIARPTPTPDPIRAAARTDAPIDNQARHDALTHLLDSYGDDATLALLDVARYAGIAVAYLDRAALQAHIGRDFTDAEWTHLTPYLDGYDEWLDNSGAGESIDYWISDVLLPQAGIDPDATSDDGAQQEHQ